MHKIYELKIYQDNIGQLNSITNVNLSMLQKLQPNSETREQSIDIERVQNMDYVSTFIEEIQCVICKNILIEPENCSKCEKYFCSHCYNQWYPLNQQLRISQQDEPECPCCRATLVQYQSTKPRLLFYLLNKVKLFCRNQEQGCEEIIDYEFRLKHEMECCEFRIVQCSNCKEKIVFKDLTTHERLCNNEIVECDKCSELLEKKCLVNHKDNLCLFRDVKCLKCHMCLQFRDLDMHQLFCPQRQVTCDECKANFILADIGQHTEIICLTRQRNYYKKMLHQARNKSRKLQKKLEFLKAMYDLDSDM